jgi:hypothetical protein
MVTVNAWMTGDELSSAKMAPKARFDLPFWQSLFLILLLKAAR